jgi:hypothetical protein
LSPGDTFVIRYVRGGVVRGARPLRYIEDRSGYTAGWLPAGTIVAYPTFADGSGLRSRPIEQRFDEADRAHKLVPWKPDGILMLTPHDGMHSIWVFPTGWYVNLERRHHRHGTTIDTRDLVLDLWCERPREWLWKDEDELELAVAVGWLTRELADRVRAEGERVGALIERWEPPFSDGWEHWRPDPYWPLPQLPEGWDVL